MVTAFEVETGGGGGSNYTVNTESKFYWLRGVPNEVYLARRLRGAIDHASDLDALTRIRAEIESLMIATSAGTAHER